MIYLDIDSSGTFVPGGDPFVDSNGDGVWNAGEPFTDIDGLGYTYGDFAISGAVIELHSDGPDGINGTADDITLYTTTDANGHYEFSGLLPGTYELTATSAGASSYTVNGASNTTGTTTIVLGSGVNVNPVFGLVIGGSTTVSVELMSFKAQDNCNSIALTWSVGIEDDLSIYFVQRSYDGVVFTTIGQVEATGDVTYKYNDATPQQGNNYYRLSMLNVDGSIDNSSVLVAESKCTPTVQVISVYPNPVDHTLYFNIESANDMDISLVMIDEIGRVVLSEPKQVVAGKNTIDLNTTSLAKAVYYAGILGKDGTFIGLSKVVVAR
jgi:hypothetical protein